MANRLQTCADCKFFELKPNGMGLCHRFPPQVAGSFVGQPHPTIPDQVVGKILNDTFWPIVPSSSYCGEFAMNLMILGKGN